MSEFKDSINWYTVSKYQKLSEKFIKKHKKYVDWSCISKFQKLSESFIRKFKHKVNWEHISTFQKLSEDFIIEFKNKLDLKIIRQYQKLSEKNLKKFNLKIPKKCWLYKTGNEKLEVVRQCGLYTIEGDFVIAYKGVRRDSYSFFNFQYKYEVGQTYEAHADHNIHNEASFGLSAWTYEGAKGYCSQMILKVRIHKDDIAALVHNDNKIRATKIEVLEIVETN